MKKLTITIALMLIVALAMPAFGASFSDVPASHWSYNAINKLVAAGIVEGYPDGEYKGDKSMTRYEMAVMVSRALDNIVDEMDAMGQGLTTGQAEDVTAIVKSLMEKNTNESLSDAQAEEVADIVDALTFELRAELKVLGADVEALGKDVDELAAKVDAMDVPEDNIEFGMDITTNFEVANYGDDNLERAVSLALLADGDAIDENPFTDPDEFASEKAFFQEYDFNINGTLGDAEFNLDVDTISNVFTEEDHVFDLVSETDSSEFTMDTALLEVAYNGYGFRIGDLNDYSIAPYFNDEEDREGIEMTYNYMDNDIKAFVLGNDTNYSSDADNFKDYADYEDTDDEEYYGLEVGRDMDFGRLTGKLYHARDLNVIDEHLTDLFNTPTNDVFANEKNSFTIVGLQLEDIAVTDAFTMGAEVAVSNWELESYYDTNGAKVDADADESGTFFNVNGEFIATEDLTIDGKIEVVDDEFIGPYNDLEELFDYDMYNLGAEYVLNENNTINGAFTLVNPGKELEDIYGDDENKNIFELGLVNTYGDFTNNASIELTQNDDFTDDYDSTVITLGTEYAWDETLTLGAELVNKNADDDSINAEMSYNYLTAFADKKLAENITWNTNLMFLDGDIKGEVTNNNGNDISVDEDGKASALTTSLTVSF